MTQLLLCVRFVYMNTDSTGGMRILEIALKRPIKDIIDDALAESPDKESAAQLLGVSRQTLWVWMGRLGMNGSK